MGRESMQTRSLPGGFSTRQEEGGGLYIEGYFAVFNSGYELWPGATERVEPGAFADTIGGDIRALVDHETRLVLGRTTAGTLELREDHHGLWGRVNINQDDTDAMNLYARVQRGDITQCSFGFDILEEDTNYGEDGTVCWTIKKVRLYEVSVCTFPAYEATGVVARKRAVEDHKTRKIEAWRGAMHQRMKKEGIGHGTKSTDASEKAGRKTGGS